MNKWIVQLLIVAAGFFSAALQAQTIVAKPVRIGFYKATQRHIDVVVLHSTFNASGGDRYNLNAILHQFARYRVAAHYLIDRQGTIFQLVSDADIAKHAGRSTLPDGSGEINSRSIGIELINDTIDSPTELQYKSLTELLVKLCSNYPIRHLVRHSDIAPQRKTDPWNTDWDGIRQRLRLYGLNF